MARLWLGNIESSATDEEVREFLLKYGFPEFDEVQHVPGTGARPARVLTFKDVHPEALHKLKEKIHDIYWRKGRVVAQILNDDFA